MAGSSSQGRRYLVRVNTKMSRWRAGLKDPIDQAKGRPCQVRISWPEGLWRLGWAGHRRRHESKQRRPRNETQDQLRLKFEPMRLPRVDLRPTNQLLVLGGGGLEAAVAPKELHSGHGDNSA
jgi:hypothetical protein